MFDYRWGSRLVFGFCLLIVIGEFKLGFFNFWDEKINNMVLDIFWLGKGRLGSFVSYKYFF